RTLIEMAQARPATLDQMAAINGIGAKKLEQYGRTFLEVITGEAEDMHPTRRKLAGRSEGDVYDRLMAVQADLHHGQDGLEKPLSCSASLISRVAQTRPRGPAEMARLLGERRNDRFGAAFLDVLQTAD
ncbi:MAG: HRDC domain-containing protein, partial [Pseudomonadota bacterium]